MVTASYRPDESRATIIQEETWLLGAFFSTTFLGVQVTLFAFTFLAIIKRRAPSRPRMRIILFSYLAILFVVTTTAQVLLVVWMQMAFITQRNYPGGPSAFLVAEYGTPVNLVSDILVVCANWMMESLLVWRCYVVCSPGERIWVFCLTVPLFFLVSVFVTGSLFIHNSVHTAPLAKYGVAYGVSSLMLNLIATGLIAGRLFVYRRHVVRQLGPGQGQHYVSILTVIVESAAIYTTFLVVVIAAYALESPAMNMLQQVIEPVQTIASLLIILRIARGEGWSTGTDTEPASGIGSAWNTHIGQDAEHSVIRLAVVSTPAYEEASVLRKKRAERQDPDVGHNV